MSPRPRNLTDHHIIAVAATVAAERGAQHTRLADVAAASGLAAATLVQRFGSREALLDAVGAAYVVEIQSLFTSREAPIPGLQAALTRLEICRHLGFFAVQPRHANRYSLELRKHIAFSLAAAVEAGAVAPCDIASIARRLQLAYYGLATAASLENGKLTSDVVADLLNTELTDHM